MGMDSNCDTKCTAVPWRRRADAADAYEKAENERLRVFCMGVIVCTQSGQAASELLKIGDSAVNGTLDYNALRGFYKIVVEDKRTGDCLFWGDNAGSQIFFIDESRQSFSDSLLALREDRGKDVKLCDAALSQMLYLGFCPTGQTLIEGIYHTDAEKTYRLHAGRITAADKELLPFEKLPRDRSLHTVMEELCSAVRERRLCAVCTGGTDSRAVLAHLIACGKRPALVLTGYRDNPDVAAAERIAAALELPLTIIDPAEKETDWLEKAFRFTDGIYDPVLGYRMMRKAQWVKDNGFAFEFGGVGGEFYKNYYCKPFRYGLFGKRITPETLYGRLFVPTAKNPSRWVGERIQAAYRQSEEALLALVRERLEPGMLRAFNRVGYRLLQESYCRTTNNMAVMGTHITPLMDRGLVAAVSARSPIGLSMHRWQRREVARYCDSISRLPTDQGYTCSTAPLLLAAESCKKLLFWSSRVLARVQKRLKRAYKDTTQRYWDRDYGDAAATPQFASALAACKGRGVVKETAQAKDIPLNAVGTLLMLGMLLDGEAENCS